MKQILFILFTFMKFSAALDYYPEAFYETHFEYINFGKISEACLTIEKFQNYRDDFSCTQGSILYISPLDTTVTFATLFDSEQIWVYRNTQVCEGDFFSLTAVGQSGTLQFSEVLLAEFMRLQELGVVNMEKDSAESFILSVIDSLKMGNGGECDIDMAYGTGHMLPNYSCCSLVESPSAISLHSFVQNHLHTIKISQGKFRINGADLGTPYKLFDLNGKLLRSGVLQSREVTTPSSPAILDIAGKRLLLK